MIPVKQRIVHGSYGDCMKATIASLLELPYDAVPHFLAFPNDGLSWYRNMSYFFRANGYNLAGNGFPEDLRDDYLRPQTPIRFEDSIKGFFYAVVPSMRFKHATHAVIMDMNGYCAYDPNPLGLYTGMNILKGKRLRRWYLHEKREKGWEREL